MTCKDCHGSGKYQPLIGLPEPCRACQDAPDQHLGRVPFDDLWLSRPVDNFHKMVVTLMDQGFNAFYPIRYTIDGKGRMVILDGNVRVAALRYLEVHYCESFNKILPDGMIPAKEII